MFSLKRALPRVSELVQVLRVEQQGPVQRLSPFVQMTLSALYPPPAELAKNAHIKSKQQYDTMYKQSLEDPDTFWSEQAKAFHWTKRWTSPVVKYAQFAATWCRNLTTSFSSQQQAVACLCMLMLLLPPGLLIGNAAKFGVTSSCAARQVQCCLVMCMLVKTVPPLQDTDNHANTAAAATISILTKDLFR